MSSGTRRKPYHGTYIDPETNQMFNCLWFRFHSYPTHCYQTHTLFQNLQSAPKTTKEFIKIRKKFINSGRANTMGTPSK